LVQRLKARGDASLGGASPLRFGHYPHPSNRWAEGFTSRPVAAHLHEEAIASFDRALEADLQHAVTLHSRGLAFYRLGRDEEAVTDYDRALAVDASAPDTGRAFFCLAGTGLRYQFKISE
jgi:tetratricopeptide (TPR) repeat protein